MENSFKRKRRKAGDLLPILRAHKNEFADWAYAGQPESMRIIFPNLGRDQAILQRCQNNGIGEFPDISIQDFLNDKQQKEMTEEEKEKEKRMDIEKESALEKYFSRIPFETFYNPEVIKIYGKSLKTIREQRKYPLKGIAENLKIEFQNLDEIEKGKRKKIDRDILVLLCGIYHICPEDILGIQRISAESPMEFFADATSGKANYILSHLFLDAPLLLQTLLEIVHFSAQKQRLVIDNAKSRFRIKVLSEQQIENRIQKSCKHYSKNWSCDSYLNRDACYRVLCDLGVGNPNLLNLFVSIAAAGKKNYPTILLHLVNSDFLEFA